jgi:hypothetical protein
MGSITLPPYSQVEKYEGLGNFAIGKYYKFPYNIFYTMKFKLIVSLLSDHLYKNILDFGSGPAEIFRPELKKHGLVVTCLDRENELDIRSSYDLIVCASVLEFVWLQTTIARLRRVCKENGSIIICSVCDNWMTRLYFRLIGDENTRHSKSEIMSHVNKYFKVVQEKSWMGLYWVCKAYPK